MTLTAKHYLACIAAIAFVGCAGHGSGQGGSDGGIAPVPECVLGGCSGQLCISSELEPPVTTCEWREEYACYAEATCEVQDDGRCGWTQTDELAACLEEASDSEPVPSDECVVGGCSGQLCVPAGSDSASTCEWLEEYACYDDADCELQASGECGWTPTEELSTCIEEARSSANE